MREERGGSGGMTVREAREGSGGMPVREERGGSGGMPVSKSNGCLAWTPSCPLSPTQQHMIIDGRRVRASIIIARLRSSHTH